MKYLEMISQNAKDANKEAKEFAAEEAKLQVEASILETKRAKADAERKLKAAQRAEPYVLQDEIDLVVEIEAMDTALKVAKEIFTTRF